ncbi:MULTISPECIES: response regulator transcription factor [Ignavibacterium]|jgi:DNA-binding response OmpR family regulator|uniref:response regulator transcription factor n=1 Tax=Ignavibacterium TaxID=795750 RepID=UPI0025BB642E|nr:MULTISPECIES: response regulator transcription factor [Ignavibacterium]MBI5662803.1 response regulator transcription factor [Ignavibacterium album]
MQILIAEDEQQIAESLKKNFRDEGFNAMIACDGEMALKLLDEIEFDLLLLDWRMPKLSGLDVCRTLRQKGIQIPIILLTALGDLSNKVEAFNAGADDYITKPFSFDEVLARINAVVRRYRLSKDIIEFEDFTLDLSRRLVITLDKKQIHLSDKEFDLLKFLVQKKGEIVSKEILCKNVWNLNFVPQTNICEATVKNLRKKLEEATGKKYIKTIYGEGYSLIAD